MTDDNTNNPNKVVAEDDNELCSRIDWSMQTLQNHPEGMEKAMAENIALMEMYTKQIIENGSIEDIEAALKQNLDQLASLQRHIDKLTTGV